MPSDGGYQALICEDADVRQPMQSDGGYQALICEEADVRQIAPLERSPSYGSQKGNGFQDDRMCDLQEVLPSTPPTAFDECMEWIRDNMVIVPDKKHKHSTGLLNFWDMFVMSLLFLAAFYEPFNLALATRENSWTVLFNEVLDVSFTADLVLHFFLAYQNSQESSSENIWERNPVKIAQRYMAFPLSDKGRAGWFWLDLLSVAPGWVELCLKVFSTSEANGASATAHVVHFFRFFRLIRMTRMVRLAEVVERWHAAYGWPFYVTEILKFVLITVITCHWAACVWVIIEGKVTRGYISYNSQDQESWLSVLINSKGDTCSPNAQSDPLCVYILALYWAMMTLTTVGYGDITPQNQFEYAMCTVFMLISGFIWAYIVGSVVSLLASLDPHGVRFKQNMDDLNDLMTNRDLPHSLQVKLRNYLLNAKHIARLRSQQGLLKNNLSDGLQREIAEQTPLTSVLKEKVFWTKDLEQGALLQIVTALLPHLYGPHEVIKVRERMVILRDGLMACRNRLYRRGDVFGHDTILLETAALADVVAPKTLTYLDLLSLEKEDLREVCRNFPLADRRIRRAQIRTAVFKNFLKSARERMRMVRRSQYVGYIPKPARGSVGGSLLLHADSGPHRAGSASFADSSSDHNSIQRILPDSLARHQTSVEEYMLRSEERINERQEQLVLQLQENVLAQLKELKADIASVKDKKKSSEAAFSPRWTKDWLRSPRPAGGTPLSSPRLDPAARDNAPSRNSE